MKSNAFSPDPAATVQSNDGQMQQILERLGSGEGLPVGLQIVGRRFDDLGVLQAAAAFEQIAPWADKRPNLR